MNWVFPAMWQDPSWSFLSSLSAQAGLLILLAAGLSFLLRRSNPRLRHLVWVVVLARLALPVAFLSPLGILPAPQSGSVVIEQQVAGVEVGADAGEVPSILSGTLGAMAARSVLPAWLAGVLIVGGLTIRRAVAFRRSIERESAPATGSLSRRVKLLSEEMGLPRAPRVRVLDQGSMLAGPALFGLTRPILLLPASTSRLWSDETLGPVLVHELAHLRRRDHWVNALQWIVQVLYFFHPLVWWANRRLRIERELATDDEVAHRCGSEAYLAALLVLAESRVAGLTPAPACVAMAESRRLLPERIRRMSSMKTTESVSTTRTRALLVSVLALACFFVLLSACQPPSPQSAEGAPKMPGVDGVTEPVLVHRVDPLYPEEARRARFEGKVILQVVVRITGEVDEVTILKAPPDDLGLAESAVEAVRQWRYEPSTSDGDPVDVFITVVVSYKLDDNKEGGGGEPTA